MELFKNKDKYNIEAKDDTSQEIYVSIGNYRLTLTKDDNICELSYIDSNTFYIKDTFASISISKFNDFCNRLKKIIADWNIEYSGDESIAWNLKIDIEGLNKRVIGNGAYPKNWNEFIDLLSEYEILFKKLLSSINKEKQEKDADKYLKEI